MRYSDVMLLWIPESFHYFTTIHFVKQTDQELFVSPSNDVADVWMEISVFFIRFTKKTILNCSISALLEYRFQIRKILNYQNLFEKSSSHI